MAEEPMSREELAGHIRSCNSLIDLFKARANIHRAEMLGLETAVGQVERERAGFQRQLAEVIDATATIPSEKANPDSLIER